MNAPGAFFRFCDNREQEEVIEDSNEDDDSELNAVDELAILAWLIQWTVPSQMRRS